MPIYEYSCGECGKTFEQIRRFSDPPLEACKFCGAPNPKKLMSASAFHLKGSGWYATDYGPSGGRSGGGVSAKSSSPSEEKPTSSSDASESTSDTKTETKTEASPKA